MDSQKMKYLFVPGKLDYVRGKRPKVKCILCGVIHKDKRVTPLVIHETDLFLVSVNLFPYNPGHLLLFPRRHIEDPRELTPAEGAEQVRLTGLSMDVLDGIYRPHGYNLGCNIGEASGASLAHFHFHIVPRYFKDKSFVDVLEGARVFVEDPHQGLKKLRKAFKDASGRGNIQPFK